MCEPRMIRLDSSVLWKRSHTPKISQRRLPKYRTLQSLSDGVSKVGAREIMSSLYCLYFPTRGSTSKLCKRGLRRERRSPNHKTLLGIISTNCWRQTFVKAVNGIKTRKKSEFKPSGINILLYLPIVIADFTTLSTQQLGNILIAENLLIYF